MANNTTSVGVNYWNLSAGTDPNMEKNVSGSAVFSGSNVEFQPGEVSFGPYNGPTAAQFIVQTTGTYVIDATFQTDQKRTSGSNPVTSDGTTGYVYVNGTSVYSQALTDPGGAQLGTAASYNGTPMLLVAGEMVLFVVGGGAFTTQVDATLDNVPEPSSFALVLGGVLLLLGVPRVRAACKL